MNLKNASPIELAALTWWKGHRPLMFSEADHLANPTINLCTAEDKALATLVAEALKTQGEGIPEEARTEDLRVLLKKWTGKVVNPE